jgi:flagellar basal body-associated protein FliL
MADPKKDDAEAGKQPEAKKSKLPMILGGGALAMVALGYTLSLMAVPAKHTPKPHIEGPFVSPLSKTDVQVNLAGEGNKRYLLMALQAEYLAYDEQYVKGRLGLMDGGVEDPVYTAQLKDALLEVASTKTREQVTNPVMLDGFLEEVRVALEPILFPVYIGDTHLPGAPDTQSGLRWVTLLRRSASGVSCTTTPSTSTASSNALVLAADRGSTSKAKSATCG